jgi:hypothetical protein
MLTPNDPGSGRLFFWSRQGISLRELLQMVADMIANGGVVLPPPTTVPGGPGGGFTLVEDPDHPGLWYLVSATGGSGGSALMIGTVAGTAADGGATIAALAALNAAVAVKAPNTGAVLTNPTLTGTVTVTDGALAIADISGLSAAVAGLGNTTIIDGYSSARNNPSTGTALPLPPLGVAIWITHNAPGPPPASVAGDVVWNEVS